MNNMKFEITFIYRCVVDQSEDGNRTFPFVPSEIRAAFFKLWSADHKWSSDSARVVLLD